MISSACSIPLVYGADMIGFTQLIQLMEVDCRATAPSEIGYKLIVVPELQASSCVPRSGGKAVESLLMEVRCRHPVNRFATILYARAGRTGLKHRLGN